jgi:rhodanese-related sulfurtransferase
MNERPLKKLCMLLLLFYAFAGCSQHQSKPINQVSQKELKSGILVDVRTPEEYAAGHLEEALNVNLFREDFVRVADTLPKDKTIYLYCQKGGRSARAARILDSLGYRVVDLLGGYETWITPRQ